jgi:acetyl-CoA synthetase
VLATAATAPLFARILATAEPPLPTLQLFQAGPEPAVAGWRAFSREYWAFPAVYIRDWPTRPDAELLLYFTSGTTAAPKMVVHTHASYPVGHLSYAVAW